MNLNKKDFKNMTSIATYLEVVIDIDGKKETQYCVGVIIENKDKITVEDLSEIPVPLSEEVVLMMSDLELKSKDILNGLTLGMPGITFISAQLYAADTLKVLSEPFMLKDREKRLLKLQYCLMFEHNNTGYALAGTIFNPGKGEYGVMLMDMRKNPQFFKFDFLPDIQHLVTHAPAITQSGIPMEVLRNPLKWRVLTVESVQVVTSIESYVESIKRNSRRNNTI